jgi:enoyl-CoA hydratase/carnithine racemase
MSLDGDVRPVTPTKPTADEQPEVVVTPGDQIVTITLNRPTRLNALTPAMRSNLLASLDEADRDPGVRAIVITGAGRGFCAGMDFDALASIGEPGADGSGGRPLDLPMHMTTPVVAAVNGPVAGVGLAYALMADVRFTAAGATWIAPYASLGLVAEFGMSWLMQRLVGRGATLEFLLSAAPMTAEDAYRIGLVQRVCTPERVVVEAQELARRIARNSAYSVRMLREQVFADASRSWDEAFADSVTRTAAALSGEDFLAAMQARRKDRAPQTAT